MPPGRLKGVPAIRTSRRCSWYDAATHIRYSNNADTFAITTRRSKVLEIASAATTTAYSTIAIAGVR